MNIFGVRHLSPGAAYHLNAYLDKIKPKYVLIEGPADAIELLKNLANKKLRPPVALLAYTTELPIETILYPFAEYSPEFQAIVWAIKNKADVRMIDLPSDVILKLKQNKHPSTDTSEEEYAEQQAYYSYHNGLYQQLAQHYNETDYESYWERNFEHNLLEGTYQEGLRYQSEQIRELVVDQEQQAVPSDFAYNLVRESHIRREIASLINQGVSPDKMVIVVGAYHVAGLTQDLPPMTDQEYKDLPRVTTQMTLMPYSYHRLSSRTGYGAGNKAPFYFEMMWQCIQDKCLHNLPAIYLSKIARILRTTGNNASSASVIEAVRLANTLSAMHNGSLPTLSDLHDAVQTCFGEGDLMSVAEAINRVDIGTAIGFIPEGVSQTPVQEDVNRQLKRLKLTEYKSTVAQELALDLRENIKVKTVEAAYIDLNRSTFLHRLQLLKIQFAKPLAVAQQTASWSEKWNLQWSPEVEIEIVESNLKGETIEVAAAFELKEQLDACETVENAAALIKTACECGLIHNFSNAIGVLQKLLVDSFDFKEIAGAARELSLLLQYGNLRQFDLSNLVPILQQLFLRGSLVLVDACNCDDAAAKKVAQAINTLDLISQEQYEIVDSQVWNEEVMKAALRDDLNTTLSGTAFSILLAHNLISDDECAHEVSRRLSPSVPADLGAGWFEGLSSRNHYALLSRISLWRELDGYLQSLTEEEFFRSVVFLRRAFGRFESNHKNSIAELLGDIWGTGAEATAELLQEELSESETEKLDALNDFDFDDL